MTFAEVMKELEESGTAQNRKIYARHGASANMFGVSFDDLYQMQKKLKINHQLAEQLWATGNHDAQMLATLVADPERMTDRLAEEWAMGLTGYGMADMFARFLGKSPLARKKAEKWNKSKAEMISSAGWGLIGQLALNDQSLPDDYFDPYLEIIERDIHHRKNRVRYAMNTALIAIGLRSSELERKALAVAKKIGKVEVDHGDTNCKTPDAAQYIAKAKEYRRKKKAKAAKT
jgi:3-methyladenine DNA glycosylase AlkD